MQNDIIITSSKCTLFAPLYSREIGHLALNDIYSLIQAKRNMTLYRDMLIISIGKKKSLRKCFIGKRKKMGDMTASEKRLSTRQW
jgi:hypothetical protein